MKRMVTHYNLWLISLLLLFFSSANADSHQLTVAAANSTCATIKKVGELFKKKSNININYICKSSGRLAKGIKGKAIKADIYISANKSWMDKMIESKMVEQNRVSSLWGNLLVVSTNKQSQLKLDEWIELTSNKVKTIIIGDPGTAPFGRYAKQALKSTGIWESVKHKIETKKHITLLADTVAKSEHGTVGILFRTNVNSEMKVIYSLDESWHKPVLYYSAPVTGSANSAESRSFLKFIKDIDAQQVFKDAGFKVF